MRRGGRWCCVVERRACVLVWTAKRVSRPPCGQGASQVGATYVTAVVRNPAEPNRSWQGLFLVDTGATDSLIPRTCLEAIGLKPKGQRVYELADGREIEMDITTADIEFMGEVVGSTIVISDEETEPLLGVTALESVGIEIDPRNQQLKRLPSIRLKPLPTA